MTVTDQRNASQPEVTQPEATQSSATLPRAVQSKAAQASVAPFAGYRPHAPGYTRLMGALFCGGVGTFTQLYAPQALLPQLTQGLGISEGDSGLVVSMGTVGLALGVFPWAWIADRIGRVPAMRYATVVGAVAAVLGAFSPTLHILLLSRLVTGFAVGAVPVLALSFLNSQMNPAFAARAAGVFVAGNSVGGLLGRLVAGTSGAQWGWSAGLLLAALFGAAFSLAFAYLVPSERTSAHTSQVASPAPGSGSALPANTLDVTQKRNPFVANLTDLTQLRIFAIGFLLMGVFVPIYNFLGFRLQHAFGVPEHYTSMLFFGVLSGVFTALWAAALVERLGRSYVVAGSAVVMAAGLAATLIPHLWAQVAGLLLVSIGFFGGHSVASGWASVGNPTTRTQAGALYTLAYYGGGSVLGWLGGSVFGGWGWGALMVLLAVCAIACALVAVSLRSPSVANSSTPLPTH